MIKITVNSTRSPDLAAREFGTAVAKGCAETLLSWRREFVPQHFTHAGAKKYGYQLRSGESEPAYVPRDVSRKKEMFVRYRMVPNKHYTWRKFRQMGHTLPLVWSGKSRAAATTGALKVTMSKKGARAVFSALPRYFYQFRADLHQPDKYMELTTVAPDETAALAHVLDQAVNKHMNAIRESRSVVIA